MVFASFVEKFLHIKKTLKILIYILVVLLEINKDVLRSHK